jgi:hypothetical protein
MQKNIRELEMVQRRAACFVTGNYRTTSSVTQMLEALQWTELQQRRKRAKVIMLYRILNHLVTISPQLYLIPRGINLQITSGVLSQMTIYTSPMETSFQQIIYKY